MHLLSQLILLGQLGSGGVNSNTMKYILIFLPFLAFSQSYVGIGTDGLRVEYVTTANVSNDVYTGRVVLNETNSTVISPALKRPYVSISTSGGTTAARFTLGVPATGTPTVSSITSSSVVIAVSAGRNPSGWETCEITTSHKLNSSGSFTTILQTTHPITLSGLTSASLYNLRTRYRHVASGLSGTLSTQVNFTTLP